MILGSGCYNFKHKKHHVRWFNGVCYKKFYEPFTINLNFWLTWHLNNMT